MHCALHSILVTAPAFWCFCCFASGAAVALYHPGWFWQIVLALALFLCSWLGKNKLCESCWSLLLALAGYAWGLLFFACPWQTYLQKMPRQECYARLALQISEAPGLPQELQKLSSGREKWQAKILALQTHASVCWQSASGSVLLQSNKDCLSELQQLKLGQRIIAEGCLLLPPAKGSPGAYYGDYLKVLGMRRIFRLQKILVVDSMEPGFPLRFRKKLQDFRGRLACRLAAGIRDPDACRMLLALGLGMHELLRTETNRQFIRSGTIHIFSISGLHVGMVILLAEGVLRCCGFGLRLRWFLLLPLLSAYLLLTGNSASALRAFHMCLLLLYACWRFRPPSALNGLGFSGLLALIGNPLYVLHSGFLYSYLIVLVLILGWPAIGELRAILQEKTRWIPRKYQGTIRFHRLGSNLATAFAGSFLAWLGSAGISLRLNGQLCLLSPLLNLPLGSTVFIILAFCPLKLLLGFVPAGQVFSARLAEFLLYNLLFWAETGAASRLTWYAVPFSNQETFLYHLALILWLLTLMSRNLNRQLGGQQKNSSSKA